MAQITWGDIAFPADCDGTLVFPALPEYADDCVAVPGKAQISSLIFREDGATAALTYTGSPAVVTATASGVDNTLDDGTKSKVIPCTGSIDAPEEEIYEGPGEVDVIVARTYNLNLQIPYASLAEYKFLRYFQGNYRKFTFHYADLDGWVYGPAAGIRPSYVTAQFPHENSRDARKVCTLILRFITKDGDPPAYLNPLA